MPRSIPVPYYPYPIPTNLEDIPRYLYEELQRIQVALLAQPVAFAINDTEAFNVTTAVTWERLFDDGVVVPVWSVPGGEFDNTTGTWTCPQSGLYDISIHMEVSPFGAGNKVYYAGLRLNVVQDGVPDTVESTDGGDDSIPLGVTLTGLIALLYGDTLSVDATVVHDQFVGTSDINVGWQIMRMSG